jgi:predicted amidophosphoribosyltransferase
LELVTAECRKQGFEKMEWVEVLRHVKKVKDQSKLSYSDRKLNLSSAFTCIINENQLREFNEKSIILIDDVVTSGATLLGAKNALRERKMTVLGAVTACATARQLLIR